MTEELRNRLNAWGGGAPESFHVLDMQRFYDVVLQSYIDENQLDYSAFEEYLDFRGRREFGESGLTVCDKYFDHYNDLYSFLTYINYPR